MEELRILDVKLNLSSSPLDTESVTPPNFKKVTQSIKKDELNIDLPLGVFDKYAEAANAFFVSIDYIYDPVLNKGGLHKPIGDVYYNTVATESETNLPVISSDSLPLTSFIITAYQNQFEQAAKVLDIVIDTRDDEDFELTDDIRFEGLIYRAINVNYDYISRRVSGKYIELKNAL